MHAAGCSSSREQGRSLVIASHDLTMVRGLCDRAIYLRHGQLIRKGAPGEVIESYLDEVYQEAMGAGPAKPDIGMETARERRGPNHGRACD